MMAVYELSNASADDSIRSASEYDSQAEADLTAETSPEPFVYVSKSPDRPPKEWKPFLTSFNKFSELPVEIRHMIWRHTLQPRVVEIHYRKEHGFYSRVKTPVALRVCSDSRTAVGHLYALRFSSVIDDAAILFNYSLDTLYFDCHIADRLPHFLALLKEDELRHIQYLAIDHEMKDYQENVDSPIDNDNFITLNKAARAMPSVKEVLVVYGLDDLHHDHGFPEGNGTIELYDKFPWEVYEYMHCEGIHLDDEYGADECQDLPESDHLLKGFRSFAKVRSAWGWRPIKLEIQTPPWAYI